MNRAIIVTTEEGGEFSATLAAFLADNDFDAQERAEIVATITRGEPYHGGGGAALAWCASRTTGDPEAGSARQNE